MFQLKVESLCDQILEACGTCRPAESLAPQGLGDLQELRKPTDSHQSAVPNLQQSANSASSADSESPATRDFPQICNIRNPTIGKRESELYRFTPTATELGAHGCEALAGDIEFLAAQLPQDVEEFDSVIVEYLSRWHAGMEAEATGHKKQNAGRRAANLWLLQRRQRQGTS